jgi:hypothetical protein
MGCDACQWQLNAKQWPLPLTGMLHPRTRLPACWLPRCCRLHRSILADKPRVTKFNIEWDSAREASGMEVDS